MLGELEELFSANYGHEHSKLYSDYQQETPLDQQHDHSSYAQTQSPI